MPYSVDETKPTAKHAPRVEHRRVKFDRLATTAIRLLILTGARLREILTAKWEQIDIERGVFSLQIARLVESRLFFRRSPRSACGYSAH